MEVAEKPAYAAPCPLSYERVCNVGGHTIDELVPQRRETPPHCLVKEGAEKDGDCTLDNIEGGDEGSIPRAPKTILKIDTLFARAYFKY